MATVLLTITSLVIVTAASPAAPGPALVNASAVGDEAQVREYLEVEPDWRPVGWLASALTAAW